MEIIKVGQVLGGRYRLEEVLGRGGFGEVWKATDLRLAPRLVAVKFIRESRLSADLTRRFQIEARALSMLNHPNIVSITDQGIEGKRQYFVMEFLVGDSLATWIDEHRARGAWPDSLRVFDIFDQIASAIQVAHEVTDPGPIVHRDLKPGNVFLVGSGSDDAYVKVVDFGLAQLGGRGHTPSGAVFGTPAYMAPEQALGNTAAICPATDVFSLAVILLEMLTLEMQSPAQAPWWLEVVRSSPRGIALDRVRPNLPVQIWETLLHALEMSPEKRFGNAGEFRAAVLEARRQGGPLVRLPVALARLDRLRLLELEVEACRRCRLSETRRRTAFGRGGVPSQLMFLGEAPGAEEDSTGVPFSGPAGQLLDRMVAAMGLSPDDVYLSNVIKCRPPANRFPTSDEVIACRAHWHEQVSLVAPKVLVTLGGVASKTVLETTKPIAELRGTWRSYNGIPTMATYHPAFLLRNPTAKKDAWADLKIVRDRLASEIAGETRDSHH